MIRKRNQLTEIKKKMKQLGLNQKGLAEKSGFTRPEISCFLSGRCKFLKRKSAILEVLGLTKS